MHPAIRQALYESQVHTLHMLKAFVSCKQNIDIDVQLIQNIIDEFTSQLKSPSVATKPAVKTKKDPSQYNIFIGDRITEYKKMHPERNGHELMRMATHAWKSCARKKV